MLACYALDMGAPKGSNGERAKPTLEPAAAAERYERFLASCPEEREFLAEWEVADLASAPAPRA